MASIKIKFIGHASFMFETDEGQTIYIDPWLNDNPASDLKVVDVTEADVVCVTHGHVDHLGDSIQVVKQTGAVLIGSPEIGSYAAQQGITYDGAPEENELYSCPLNTGGSCTIGPTTFTMVQALHSTALHTAEWFDSMKYEPDGSVAGYVIRTDSGISLYDTADTGLFGDMALISQMYSPQIAILPVGGKYTMGVREAARAASLIRPEIVIPCHYDTFPNQRADIDQLREEVQFLSPGTQVIKLKPGESYEYSR